MDDGHVIVLGTPPMTASAPRRPWFAVWRWSCLRSCILPALVVAYVLSAPLVRFVFCRFDVAFNPDPLSAWVVDSFYIVYIPVDWCEENLIGIKELFLWEDEMLRRIVDTLSPPPIPATESLKWPIRENDAGPPREKFKGYHDPMRSWHCERLDRNHYTASGGT